MARNSITYALIMLIIGIDICYAIVEFHNTIPELPSTLSYYVAINVKLIDCIKKCRSRFPTKSKVFQECKKKCIDEFTPKPPN
ncbi:uncharacterized protein DS421_3g77510 [Arachis hypogaea]|nr:uncharacterized protein DS421_3g77510 [Arachis hypogaea]